MRKMARSKTKRFWMRKNKTSFDTPEWRKELMKNYECQQRNRDRLMTARQACIAYNLRPSKRQRHIGKYIVSKKYKFMFALTPKAASTSWKHFLRIVDPACRGSVYDGVKLDRQMLSISSQDEKEYVHAVFFREPLERLVSFYYNNLHYSSPHSGNNKDFDDEIKKIGIRNHSVMHFKRKGSIYNITFPEFGQLVLYYRANGSVPISGHVRHQHLGASLCSHMFDFIGHFETLVQDATCFLELIGAADLFSFPETHIPRGSTLFNDTLKSLPRSVLNGLIQLYKIDYDILGYAVPKIWSTENNTAAV
ncbi:carbohydrate sulfotransferase 13-like [Saccoglossus kowalevskii]